MKEECFQLKISNTREKLRTQFPQDPRGDVKIVFKSKTFKLQKAYLRLQSGYFNSKCQSNVTTLTIDEQFKINPQYIQQQFFTSIMSCFYGNKVSVPRSQIFLYFPIIRFLQIESMLGQVRKDMIDHIQSYQIFVLMKMAHQYNQHQIFETCLEQLKNEGFEQMNYNKSELLACSVELFKLIVKTHNRQKSQGAKGLQYKVIDELIKQYCQSNKLGEERHRQFKYQLIDKTKLTANQYKDIFMDQTDQAVSTQLALQMESTFHRKQNEQLKQENKELLQKISTLRQYTETNQQLNAELQNQIKTMKQKFKAKDQQENQLKATIKKFQEIVKNLQNQFAEKEISTKLLQTKVQELYKIMKNPNYQSQAEEINLIQSQIIPSNLLGDILKNNPTTNFSKDKSSETNFTNNPRILKSMDEESIEEAYHSRINFDIEPISVSKIFIPLILQFLGIQGFHQRKLLLIFRRSEKYGAIGSPSSLRNRRPLVVLMRTANGQQIGGYISAQIREDYKDFVEDSNAIIFSLSKGKMFKIKKGQEKSAVSLNQKYLIGFGDDLFIAKDVLNDPSKCSWPSYFQKGNLGQDAVWLTGGGQFRLKDFQIYEVDEQEMVMEID